MDKRRVDHSEFKEHWRLLIATLVGAGLGLPTVPYYTIGIFAPTLSEEFGWTFANIFAGLSVLTFGLLVGGPIIGRIVDRYGVRLVATYSLVAMGIAYISLAASTGSLAQYYVSWIFIVAGGIGATHISFTRAVNGVFVVKRGLALGIMLSGTGVYAFLVKHFGTFLLEVSGWRFAVISIGLLPLMIGAPIVYWGLRPKASDVVRRDKSQLSTTIPTAQTLYGVTVKEALTGRVFWILVIAFIPVSFATIAPLPNMENILASLRMPHVDIVAVTSLIGISIIAGRLIGGWLMDRVWAPLVGAVVIFGAASACWILSQPTVSSNEAMFAVVLLGLAGGVEIDLLSYLIARYMGMRNYGLIYGSLFGVFAIGGGLGPSILGYAYDQVGSYSEILSICSLVLMFSAPVLLLLGRYPSKDQLKAF